MMDLRSIVPDRVSTSAKLFLSGMILNGIGNGVFNVILQLYLMSFGFDSAAIGSIIMMSAIPATLFTIPAGILADRYGKRKIILFGFSIALLAVILILTARSIEGFRLAFLLLGVNNATGVVWTPLYSSFFSRENIDRAFGLLGFISIISLSVGSLMGLVPPMLVANYGFSRQSAYWTTLVVAVGFFLPTMPLLIMSLRGTVRPDRRGSFKFDLKPKGVVTKFCFISLVRNIGFGVFFSLFPFYTNRKFGVESDALGTLYFASNFVQAGANIIAARIAKKLGTIRTITATIGLSIPFWLTLPLAPSFTWLSIIYIMRVGIGNISTPLNDSLYMKLLYDEEKATANSITSTAAQGSNIVAPWLGGQLMEQVSLDFPAYLGAGLFVLLAVSYYSLPRDSDDR